ncbi:ferredoxin [Candidatus Poribacteria bacterium]|jgi:NAD-dependent dihydropyrimidine dehydrogenase PreA subunit|nr:ferredoxin [Candidatus Poribacteria bacterium]|tara:strand:+ start:224 stop:484 length:261 start_codon:yes stop_codon:yes gene_type:complete
MTYVICEPCVDVKDTACVDVCPVDCIHPTSDFPELFDVEKMLYIDPEECIDCGVCEPECPVEAIFAEDDVPDEWEQYTKMNADFFQ